MEQIALHHRGGTISPPSHTEVPSDTSQKSESPYGLVGSSLKMAHLRYKIERLGPLSPPVLITGETGTGKELVAHAIHQVSSRSEGPLVVVNCGALTGTLLEDTLFGHERGAFTGAHAAHQGVFEQARGGTLFLDEIGELALSHQAALLRVLENGQIMRLGARKCDVVDVRVVAATNRDLGEQVKKGLFRQDLFYRLATLTIQTPPLRERPDDIEPLVCHFLDQISTELGCRTIEESALDKLCQYHWPGNARELRNVLYRSAALSSGAALSANDIEFECPMEPYGPQIFRLEEVPDGYLLELLKRHGGNTTAAARELSIPRTSLRDRMKRIHGVRRTRANLIRLPANIAAMAVGS